MAAMEKGVAHFAIPGASSRPGQVGNTAIAGHSSNDIFDSTRYKFIFAQLDRLKEGDMIYANYDGLRYSYVVTKKEVVKPTEINKLVYDTDKPMMTLITCTPLGTALKRLLVTAEQVSPDPTVASEAPEIDEAAQEAQMPGNTQSILERIFGR
jgi:sortase A